jgi:hypothetical protein
MSEIELQIKNFPAQQSIFDSKARFKIVAKGRRFGLTKGAANDFIKCALEGSFKQGLWGDVINANIDRYIERYFIPHLNKLPPQIWSWKKQAKIVKIKDSIIDFRSADNPETWEGFGYDKSFLNEAGIILKNEYLWNHAIKPMYWDFPGGHHVIGGTPKGKGLLFELFQRGEDPAQTQYESFRFSSFDNPYLDKDGLAKDIENAPERVIKQEVYAEFLEDTGVVFRGFKEIMTAIPRGPEPGHNYTIGTDLAKLQDWTVMAVYDRSTNFQVYQARFNNLEWPVIQNRIAQTAKHYNNATVVLDSTGVGEPIHDGLARQGVGVIPIHFTNEIKKQLIEKLTHWIELKQIRMLNIDETNRELTNFTYDISEVTGRIHYEAPQGFTDDIVMAHALAIWDLVVLYRESYEKPKTLVQQDFERKVRDYTGPGDYEDQKEWAEWNN